MSLNQVVPNVANIKIGWFHRIKSQKSSGSIAPFSKIEWFHGTTGTTTNAGPGARTHLLKARPHQKHKSKSEPSCIHILHQIITHGILTSKTRYLFLRF